MRRRLARISLDRPVTVLMVLSALLVVGLIAWFRIPVQMMPDGFDPKFLWIRIPYANAAPREVDELVVRPIETQLASMPGLKTLTSRAGSQSASISLEFHSSVDMGAAYADTIDRMERAIPDLPDDADRYRVFRFNPSDAPIMWIGVTWDSTVDDPNHVITNVLSPALQRVEGVASLDVWGVPARTVQIQYDRERLAAHQVSISDVQTKLTNANFQLSAGRVTERGEVRLVRSLAQVSDLDTLRRLPIRDDGLVLSDVADIDLALVATTDISRINGREGGALVLRKESNANTVEVTKHLYEALDALKADPRAAGMHPIVFFDQGTLIESSMDALIEAALLGGLFSVIILWLFLREIRMTLLISVSIPISMLMAIGVLYMQGASLNLIAMMGLMLAVGMVVDDAIVVVESIWRLRALGLPMREAAIEGTAEIGLAVLASTGTTMVVFLPVMLMTGDATSSFFLRVLGWPVVLAMAASLIVALLLAPLASVWVGQRAEVRPDPRWLTWFSERYLRTLRTAIARPWTAAFLLAAALAATFWIAVPGVSMSSSSQGRMNDFTVRFTVPRDASYALRDAIITRLESTFEGHKDEWGLRAWRAQLDGDSLNGRIQIYVSEESPLPLNDVIREVRKGLPKDIPGVSTSIGWESDSGGSGDHTVNLSVYGEDIDQLGAVADEAIRRVSHLPGVLSAAREDAVSGLDELQLLPNRGALAHYGTSTRILASTVAFAMRGRALDTMTIHGAEVDVESRLIEEDRRDIEAMLDFPVPAAAGQIPMRALVSTHRGLGPDTIRRLNRQTSMGIVVDLDDNLEKREALGEITHALNQMALPHGVSWDASGLEASLESENRALFFSLGMSVIFVFLLMGVLFESWALPLSVLITIPLAIIGAWWGLYLTDTSLDTMAGIGLIVLVGVVVKNGIVMVDHIVQLRDEGMERDAAVLEACKRRLRPILMTAITATVGVIPMAVGGASFVGIPYAPLGRCMIGGLTASTILTLVYVPLLYNAIDDARHQAVRVARFALGEAL